MNLARILGSAPALSTGESRAIGRHGLGIYLAVTFAFSWLLLGMSVVAAAAHTSAPLPDVLIITVATLGPLFGALAARARESGREGVHTLLKQIVRWRVPLRLYSVAIFGPAAVTLLAFLLWLALGEPMPSAPAASTLLMVPVLLLALLLPALFEEAGWRGDGLLFGRGNRNVPRNVIQKMDSRRRSDRISMAASRPASASTRSVVRDGERGGSSRTISTPQPSSSRTTSFHCA